MEREREVFREEIETERWGEIKRDGEGRGGER